MRRKGRKTRRLLAEIGQLFEQLAVQGPPKARVMAKAVPEVISEEQAIKALLAEPVVPALLGTMRMNLRSQFRFEGPTVQPVPEPKKATIDTVMAQRLAGVFDPYWDAVRQAGWGSSEIMLAIRLGMTSSEALAMLESRLKK